MPKCLECRARLSRSSLRCSRCGRLLPLTTRRRIIWLVALLAVFVGLLVLLAMIPDTAVFQHVVTENGS